MKPSDRQLKKFADACKQVARRDTAYAPLELMWSKTDPLAEHCGAVAYAAKRMWGGQIMTGTKSGVRWLWCKLLTGEEIMLEGFPVGGIQGKPMRPTKTVNKRWSLFYDRLREVI